MKKCPPTSTGMKIYLILQASPKNRYHKELSVQGREIRVPVLRAFLNLWFAKPMVCVQAAFHENDGDHENDENAKATQTAENKEWSAGFAEITETTEMTKTTGIQGANHRFPKPRVQKYPSTGSPRIV